MLSKPNFEQARLRALLMQQSFKRIGVYGCDATYQQGTSAGRNASNAAMARTYDRRLTR
jgi:hypothetical protein